MQGSEGQGQGHDRPLERRDPSRMRVSDEERHQVAEYLRLAAGEGRIDLDELDQRLEATYSAKTYADLVPLTADLPAHRAAAQPQPPVTRPAYPVEPPATWTSSVAIMSETRRQGPWVVPSQHSAFAMMGSVRLDLREAQLAGPEVVLNAVAIMGEVKVLVNAHTQVIVDGMPIMGEFNESRARVPAQITATSPVVRIKGLALMGSVSVQRREMPGETRRRLTDPR